MFSPIQYRVHRSGQKLSIHPCLWWTYIRKDILNIGKSEEGDRIVPKKKELSFQRWVWHWHLSTWVLRNLETQSYRITMGTVILWFHTYLQILFSSSCYDFAFFSIKCSWFLLKPLSSWNRTPLGLKLSCANFHTIPRENLRTWRNDLFQCHWLGCFSSCPKPPSYRSASDSSLPRRRFLWRSKWVPAVPKCREPTLMKLSRVWCCSSRISKHMRRKPGKIRSWSTTSR